MRRGLGAESVKHGVRFLAQWPGSGDEPQGRGKDDNQSEPAAIVGRSVGDMQLEGAIGILLGFLVIAMLAGGRFALEYWLGIPALA